MGPYVVEGALGSGGMALVLQVRHLTLGTVQALKLLRLPAEPLRDRLLLEGRAQASLQHPNVVCVTDVLDVNGAPGLIMERVCGPPLDLVLRHETLTLAQVDLLARGILAGVAAAHRAGFVHRDLKPANVLLAPVGDEVVPKVTDFGLAKLLHDEGSVPGATRTGMGLGTPAYMSPEQTRDAKHVDARADVFSLGATLFELLTGQRAFEGTDSFDIFRKINDGQVPSLRALVPDVPERMARAVEAALQVDKELRPAHADELLVMWADGTPPPTAFGAWPAHGLATLRRLSPMVDRWDYGGVTAEGAVATYLSSNWSPALVSMEPPPVDMGYARNGSVTLAYQVSGHGLPVVFVPGFISHVELNWEAPFYRRAMERVVRFARLATYDKRGTGLSERVASVGTLDERVEDLKVVLDTIGMEKACLLAVSEGGPLALAFAAAYPERVNKLALYGTGACFSATDGDHDEALQAEMERMARIVEATWGTGKAFGLFTQHAPDKVRARAFLARFERLCATPSVAASILRATFGEDVRPLLPKVTAPSLVVHSKGDPLVRLAVGRHLADHLPGLRRFVELDGAYHVSWSALDQDTIMDPVEDFLLGP